LYQKSITTLICKAANIENWYSGASMCKLINLEKPPIEGSYDFPLALILGQVILIAKLSQEAARCTFSECFFG